MGPPKSLCIYANYVELRQDVTRPTTEPTTLALMTTTTSTMMIMMTMPDACKISELNRFSINCTSRTSTAATNTSTDIGHYRTVCLLKSRASMSFVPTVVGWNGDRKYFRILIMTFSYSGFLCPVRFCLRSECGKQFQAELFRIHYPGINSIREGRQTTLSSFNFPAQSISMSLFKNLGPLDKTQTSTSHPEKSLFQLVPVVVIVNKRNEPSSISAKEKKMEKGWQHKEVLYPEENKRADDDDSKQLTAQQFPRTKAVSLSFFGRGWLVDL